MADSIGKRQRRDINAKKAVAREERRVARAERKRDREAGLIEAGPPIGPAEQSEFLVVEPEGDGEAAENQDASGSKPSEPKAPEPAGSDARSEAEA